MHPIINIRKPASDNDFIHSAGLLRAWLISNSCLQGSRAVADLHMDKTQVWSISAYSVCTNYITITRCRALYFSEKKKKKKNLGSSKVL